MRIGGKDLTFGAQAGVVMLQLRIHALVIGQEQLQLDQARQLRAELDLAIDRAYRMAVTTPPKVAR